MIYEYNGQRCNTYKTICVDNLDRVKYEIVKNFQEMDLENADICDAIEGIVGEMLQRIEQTQEEIQWTYFEMIE